MRELIARVVSVCVQRAWLVILLATVLGTLACVYTVRHLAIDTNTANLIAPDLPWRAREAAFDAAFPQRVDLIAVVIDADAPELADSAAGALAQRLSGQPALFRAVWRPDGGEFFAQEGLLFEATPEVARTMQQLIAAQPLLGMMSADPTLRGLMNALSLMLEGIRDDPSGLDQLAPALTALADAFESVIAQRTPRFSWHALIVGRPAQPRELRRFVLVQPVLDYSGLMPGARASDAIRQAAHDLFAVDARVRVRLTGPVALADEEFATLAEGAALNSTITLAAVVALLWLALRSVRLIAAILISLTVGLVITAAFGLLLFHALNLISIAFAVLFIGLGVDFGIQFCIGYRAMRYHDADLAQALKNTGYAIGPALALAAASTAAGFYAFLPTDYRGVSELGLIAGTGMIVAFIASVTLLPALIRVLRPPPESEPIGYASFAPLDRLVTRRWRLVIGGSLLLSVASLLSLPRLAFDFNPLHLRSAKVESVATLLDLMGDPDTAPNTVDVLAPSVEAANTLAQRIGELPEVDHAITLASFVPEAQDQKLALISDAALLLDPVLNPTEPRIPADDRVTVQAIERAAQATDALKGANPQSASAAAAARLAQTLKMLTAGNSQQRQRAEAALMPAFVATLDQLRHALQAHPVSLDSLPPELVRDWVSANGRARIEVFPKGNANDNATLRRFVEAVRVIAPDATGAPVSIQESGRTIVRAFMQAGALAFAAITLLLVITLRRATDVALTLAPLLLSGVLTLGLCALFDMPLNFANIIALPLMFGIGVAFNIYFVMAWRAGQSNVLQSSLTRAVLFSALTTGTAFGSLCLSHHPGTASMGNLLALSLACTLVTALLFLPALLHAVPARRSTQASQAPASG